MRSLSRRKDAFTLVELIVVVAILILLAALLFPVISGALTGAHAANARKDVNNIADAVRAYYETYGKLPLPDDQQDETTDLGQEVIDGLDGNDADGPRKIIKILSAHEDEVYLNPKKQIFLESDKIRDDGTFLDPWDSPYQIKMDSNYDGKVEWFTGSDEHTTPVIVFSYGPDGEMGADIGEPETRDNIASVEFKTSQ